MATKQKTRKTSPTVTNTGDVILPEYSPKDADIKFTGGEPLFLEQPTEQARKGALVASLSWYGRYMDRKVAKDAILHYATERGVSAADLKALRAVNERLFNTSLCWLARLGNRGLIHTQSELARIGDHLKELLVVKTKVASVTAPAEAEPAPVVAKPNVQEIMIARAREAAGELEGMFDEYVLAGCPQPVSVNVMGVLTQHGIMAQHVGLIVNVWTDRKAEYEAVQAGTDAQLKEGYSQYTKIGVRNLIKWCDAVLAGLQSYTTVKKANRAPRKRKPVPVEKQVAKAKYLKEFKDDALGINIVGLHPAKLVGATEAWLYDVAKRRMTYMIADSHAGSLSVRGTTVTGFDATKSGVKTVRKPGLTLPVLMKAGKPAARKVFADLTTTPTKPTGRTNEETIILRVI